MSADGLAISFVIMVRLQRTLGLNSGFVPRLASAADAVSGRFPDPAVDRLRAKSLLTPKGSIFAGDKAPDVHVISRRVAARVLSTALSAHDQHRSEGRHLSQLH